MEPRHDEPRKESEPRKEAKTRKRRFQIVKLEERIAPAKGGNHTRRGACYTRSVHYCA